MPATAGIGEGSPRNDGEIEMGIAAYNRGTEAIRRDIAKGDRAAEFAMMDRLNAIPRQSGASTPFGPVHFINSHSGWWAECPITGFGYWYKTLVQAVSSWRVDVVGYERGIWIATPRNGAR